MAGETVEKRVTKIVSRILDIDEGKIALDATFESMVTNASELLALRLKLEEEFSIEIPEEELTTLEDAINYIEGNIVV